MCTKHLQNIFAVTLLMAGTTFSNVGQANILNIDNFTHLQSVVDRGDTIGATTNTIINLTGTDLTNASRTFIAEATADKYANKKDIVSGGNLLKISNTAGSSGSASVMWNFDPIDFTSYGNAILLEVVAIDLDVNVQMIANGTSSSVINSFSGPGNYLVNFNDFSNSSAFTSVSSFRLDFNGPLAWDGQFRLLATTNSVPIPSAFFLMGSALLSCIGISCRKKQSSITAI